MWALEGEHGETFESEVMQMTIQYIERHSNGWHVAAKHVHDDGQEVYMLGSGLSDTDLVSALADASKPLSLIPRDLPAR